MDQPTAQLASGEILLDVAALLLGLTALFGYLNHKLLHMPRTIGVVVIALVASLGLVALHLVVPQWGLADAASGILSQIDFRQTLMYGFLSFLIFAGALNIDLDQLVSVRRPVLVLATVGVVISTLVVAAGMWLVWRMLGLDVSFAYCAVFGALISPTDPVAVIGIVQRMGLPPRLETEIAGESLLNDGVAIVVFGITVQIASASQGDIGAAHVIGLFLLEAVGGGLLGLVLGGIAFFAMRSLDEYTVEILITLALAVIAYALAIRLDLSGPIALVVAGILIGNPGKRLAMSDRTRDHLWQFWSVIDEILNALLFLLIGLEALVVSRQPAVVGAGLLAIPVVLIARVVSLATPLTVLRLWLARPRRELAILTWGGLHGGISVALALTLPASPVQRVLLTACYIVVIFSIVVQGLTLEPLLRRLRRHDAAA